jgi:predicted transcriptional regulator
MTVRTALSLLLLAIVTGTGLAAAQTGSAPSADTGAAPSLDTGLGDSLFSGIDPLTGVAIGAGVMLALAGLATLFFLGGAKFVNSGNVLENDARRSIFEYIQQHPGVHLRAAATALALSTTNVLWHLRKLEDANLVTSKKFEGYKVFYPVEGGVETKKRAIASSVLRNENAMGILEYVSANPSAHQREIARALGVNHGTIRWHLRKLEEAGLLAPMKREHTTHYYVSDLGQEALRGFAVRATAPAQAPPVPPTASVPTDDA